MIVRPQAKKSLIQKQSCFGWRNLILPRSREHSRFRIHIWFLYPSRVTQTTNIGPKTRSPLLLGLGSSIGLSVLSYPE